MPCPSLECTKNISQACAKFPVSSMMSYACSRVSIENARGGENVNFCENIAPGRPQREGGELRKNNTTLRGEPPLGRCRETCCFVFAHSSSTAVVVGISLTMKIILLRIQLSNRTTTPPASPQTGIRNNVKYRNKGKIVAGMNDVNFCKRPVWRPRHWTTKERTGQTRREVDVGDKKQNQPKELTLGRTQKCKICSSPVEYRGGG